MACTWLLAIIFLISSATGLQTMNCSAPELTVNIDVDKKIIIQNPTISFLYNRDTVRIYEYPGTPSVNVFVDNSAISIKGQVENYNTGFDLNNEKFFITETIGIANIANTSDFQKGLKDCKFFILDKLSKRMCHIKFLSQELGSISYEDFGRARMTPHNFGRKSINSPYVLLTYPNIIAPKTSENIWFRNEANSEEAADFILKTVSNKFHEQNAGIVPISDIKDQVFTASRGTFRGIDNLQRVPTMKVPMSKLRDGEKFFSFTFFIPKGHVQYEDYQAFQIIPLVINLCADVQDLMFTAIITMDFKGKYCKAKLQDLRMFSPGYSRSYTCGRLSFLTNTIMQWFAKAWGEESINSIKSQIYRVMDTSIYEKFDCEAFRAYFK